MNNQNTLLLCFLCFLTSNQVSLAGGAEIHGVATAAEAAEECGSNPFTPKASLIRYWSKEIKPDSPKPTFFLSKASPLTAVQSAVFTDLAIRHALHTRLSDFCISAKLFCFPELTSILERHPDNADFSVYLNRNFTNYGSDRLGGTDSFKNYSSGDNIPVDSFRRYSRSSAGHDDRFANYADDGNVADQAFNTYGSGSTGGTGQFNIYQTNVNELNGRFTSYSDGANGRPQSFTGYSADANAGAQSFTSYGKNGNGAPNEFSGYGVGSNVVRTGFSGYGRSANGANDSFSSYGSKSNIPSNDFKSYGDGGNNAVYGFKNYRDESNIGVDSFSSYAKKSETENINFVNYGKSFNLGTSNFTSYGEGAEDQEIRFSNYGTNPNFKEYSKNGVVFSRYTNLSNDVVKAESGKIVNKWVEQGKFFRESVLKEGNLMTMPDIRDKMPKRSFLPRVIASKLPFSASEIGEIKKIFGARDNSSMEKIISAALVECERAPSSGETKRCVGSAEDMIDFVTSVIGRQVAVRTTENVNGSMSRVAIGKVRGINGGKVTKSVSCHQSLYPLLMYYCHSVPKVRVYEADLLDPDSKVKINHGVAICHLDTSAWSAGHGAFLSLGSGPGRIEVCHWIFENDMTWTLAD